MKNILFTLLVFIFLGCGSKEASHLPSILQLPGAIIGGGVDNAIYNSKRKKVKSYAKVHYDVLKTEFKQRSGVHLEKILNLAKIEKSQYTKVKKQLQESHQTIFHNTQSITERIMMVFSKLYMPTEKTKKLNGFSYIEASNIVKEHVDSNFEALRLNVKNNQTTQLAKIASKLNITNLTKRDNFIHGLDGKYDELYVDILVVSVMIHSR